MVRSYNDLPSEPMAQIIATENEPLRPSAPSTGDTEGGDIPQELTVNARVAELSDTTTSDEVAQETPFDIDKLSYAIAMAESGFCTKGKAVETNNCWNIMHWPNGVRELRRFNSIEEGKKAFIELWTTKYDGFPNTKAAKAYVGDNTWGIWLKNVNFYYNSPRQIYEK